MEHIAWFRLVRIYFYQENIVAYAQTLYQYPIKIVTLIIDIVLVAFLGYKLVKIAKGSRLENAIDKAMLFSRVDKNNLVKFELNEKVAIISSHSEIGENKDNISISLQGKELAIAFNARYFSEALRVIDDEYIKLNFNSSISPCVIQANDNENFTNLILPVRIS